MRLLGGQVNPKEHDAYKHAHTPQTPESLCPQSSIEGQRLMRLKTFCKTTHPVLHDVQNIYYICIYT